MRTNDEVIELIKELLQQNQISMSELARRVDMAKSAISRYLNKTREFPLNRAEDFAKALGVSTEYLLGVSPMTDIVSVYNKLELPRQEKVYNYAEEQLREQNKVTSLQKYKEEKEKQEIELNSVLSAGTGVIDLDPEHIETIEFDGYVPKHDLAFRVSGNSMEPTFRDGEIVFVEKTPDIYNGQFIAVQINEEAYIKKVYVEDHQLRLVSLNKDYEDIIANGNDSIRVIGRIIL